CVVFDVVAAANGIVIAKSNAAFGGAFFHTSTPGPTQSLSDTPLGVVASDNDPAIFNDKPFMAADAHPGSPKRHNVYVTWTRFRSSPDGSVTFESPIYFAQSTDRGSTSSPRRSRAAAPTSSACRPTATGWTTTARAPSIRPADGCTSPGPTSATPGRARRTATASPSSRAPTTTTTCSSPLRPTAGRPGHP